MKSSAARSAPVIAVAILLALEALAAIALTAALVYELFTGPADSTSTAIGLVVMVAIAAVWIGATAIAFIRGTSFSRGSALVWNALQAALGIASNQGIFARPDIGSALLIPAIAVIAMLLFSKQISRHIGAAESEA